jgi:hypothetical protein
LAGNVAGGLFASDNAGWCPRQVDSLLDLTNGAESEIGPARFADSLSEWTDP